MTEEAILLVLDYQNICRICLKTQGVLSPIFDDDNSSYSIDNDSEEPPPLNVQLEIITGIGIWIENITNLPQKICHKCRYLVETSYNLRCEILKANELLTNSLNIDVEGVTEEEQVKSKGNKENDDQETCYFRTEILEEKLNTKSNALLKDEVEDLIFYDEDGQSFEVKMEIPKKVNDSNLEKDWRRRSFNIDKQFQQITESQVLKDLNCEICLETVGDQDALLEHISTHYQDSVLIPYYIATKPFLCQLCDQVFKKKKDLIIHHRAHLKIKPYICSYKDCLSKLRSKEALRHHMYSHKERQFVCELCGLAFKRRFELEQHMSRHKDEGTVFQCNQCRVICKNRISFKVHLRNHKIGKRFPCKMIGCLKAFFSKTDLMIHERSHANDKCFKCPLCVCAYISQSQLNRHLRQHEKKKIHKCDKCSESFMDYTDFCNHRINTHGEWLPHKCKGCNIGYESEVHLERHMSKCELSQRMSLLNKQFFNLDGNEQTEDTETVVISSRLKLDNIHEIDVEPTGDDTSVIIKASDLHLTDNNDTFHYVTTQDALTPDPETQYMIIEEDGNTSVEQYICKGLI